jgi:hypothetical protein
MRPIMKKRFECETTQGRRECQRGGGAFAGEASAFSPLELRVVEMISVCL